MTIVLTRDEKIRLSRVVGDIAKLSDALAPLSEVCDACMDFLMQLNDGSVDDDAIARAETAFAALEKHDPASLGLALQESAQFLSKALEAKFRA